MKTIESKYKLLGIFISITVDTLKITALILILLILSRFNHVSYVFLKLSH